MYTDNNLIIIKNASRGESTTEVLERLNKICKALGTARISEFTVVS